MQKQILPEINKQRGLEIGLYSIGDHITSDQSALSAKERLNQIIDLAVMAEQAGLDVFQLGESHQSQFVSQAHLTILAAIAVKTEKIKLSSGATIIGASDPVRVFEQAATIDLLSNERMELVCGRSARTGIFDLLGYSLNDYEELFEEKFDLLLEINRNEVVNWEGEFRKSLKDAHIIPRTERESKGLPIWRANAGSLDSVIQAAKAGVPLQIMQLRGSIDHYQTIIERYRQAGVEAGYVDLPVATAGFLLPKATTTEAIQTYIPRLERASELTQNQPFNQKDIDSIEDINSVINIGSPELIIEKLIAQYEHYKHDRFIAQIDFSGTTTDELKQIIDIMGTTIIPQVKKHTK